MADNNFRIKGVASMIRNKVKLAVIIAMIVNLALISPVVFLSISYYVDQYPHRLMVSYYQSNEEDFNEIAEYFKKIHEDSLFSASLEREGILQMNYYEDSKDISDERVYSLLLMLREKYSKNSPLPIFQRVIAYYDDNGNLWLSSIAHNEMRKEEGKRTNTYRIMYIDENFQSDTQHGIIDPRLHKKPFSGNWYTWWEKGHLG